MVTAVVSTVAAAVAVSVPTPPPVGPFPWQNYSLPRPERIADLLQQLTVTEKAQLMGKVNPPITRLGIEGYNYRQGTAQQCNSGYKTAFPQNLGIAASFNVSNAFLSGHVTGVEFRSDHMDYKSGLTCYGPMTNIMRHPLWGRNHEGYGEDPYLSSQMVYQMVRGLQGDDDKYLQVHADCKHFSTFDGPGNGGSAWISDRDWFSTYLPAMRACVDAKAASFMCSYAQLNGVYGCNNHRALTEVLRDTWGFDGFVVSDMGALHGAVAGVTAGCDLEDGYGTYIQLANMSLTNASLVKYIDQAAGRLLMARMKLGEFDPPAVVPFADPTKYNPARIQSPEFMKFAHDAAVQTVVLLKNDRRTLPLAGAALARVAVLGPGGNTHDHPTYGPAVTRNATTVFTALASRLGADKVGFAAGCPDAKCETYNASGVAQALSGAASAVVVLSGTGIENEGTDRRSFDLPGSTTQLLLDVIAAKIPFVVVFGSADPFNITAIHDDLPAIAQSFYPQEFNGEAVAAVLLGEYNPAARLPYTWPRSFLDDPGLGNYTMGGKTYRYGETDVLFPFGYGLSYTNFSYSDIAATGGVPTCRGVNVTVTVTNTGAVSGHEVVQVYASFDGAPLDHPAVQLVGFDKVFLAPGSKTTVTIPISVQSMALLNASDAVPSGGGGHHPPGPAPPGPPPPCTNPCCKAMPGVLIVGANYKQAAAGSKSANDCCATCAADAECTGFSYSWKAACWLKKGSGFKTENESDHTSGTIVRRTDCTATAPSAPPPPPSPPKPVPRWMAVPLQLKLSVGGQQPGAPGARAPSNVLFTTVDVGDAPRPVAECPNPRQYPQIVAPPLPSNAP